MECSKVQTFGSMRQIGRESRARAHGPLSHNDPASIGPRLSQCYPVRDRQLVHAVMPSSSASTKDVGGHSESPREHTGKPTPGAVLELECSRLALEGKGVCLLPPSNFVVLCNRALPGEKLLAQITVLKKGYAEARKLQTLAPHRHAVPAPCPHFGPCGGCSLQSMAYGAQLQEKQNQVVQTLKRVGKLSGVEDAIKPIIGCNPAFRLNNYGSDIFGYRNKLQLTFSSLCWEPAAIGSTPLSNGIPGGGLYGGCVSTRPVLGFLRPGSQTEVLPITECWLQDDTANTILENVRSEALEAHKLLPYNDPSGKGFLKHLVIRSSRPAPPSLVTSTGAHPANPQQQQQQQLEPSKLPSASESGPRSSPSEKEYMVTFVVTSQKAVAALRPVADALVASIPQVIGVLVKVVDQQHAASPAGNKAARGRRQKQGNRRRDLSQKLPQQQAQSQPALSGSRAYLVETIMGLHLRVSPDSFLQTNTAQAEVLYKAISDAAQLKPSDSLLDLYCGAGSIGLSLAQQCAHVVGYEAEGAAIADAHHNAAVNGVHNASFACVDLTAGVPDPSESRELLAASSGARAAWLSPDVIVCDPARAGLSNAVVDYLRASTARRCVYVSCNPATQARDLALLCASADEASGGASDGQHKSLKEHEQSDLQRGRKEFASASKRLSNPHLSPTPRSTGASQPSPSLSRSAPTTTASRTSASQLSTSPSRGPSRLPAFKLVSLQAVDMFPHTDHVETLAVLDRCC